MTEKKLKKMTKEALETYGRTVGIELDRRLKRATMIDQLIAFLDAKAEEESLLEVVEVEDGLVTTVEDSDNEDSEVEVIIDVVVSNDNPATAPAVNPARERRRRYMAL